MVSTFLVKKLFNIMNYKNLFDKWRLFITEQEDEEESLGGFRGGVSTGFKPVNKPGRITGLGKSRVPKEKPKEEPEDSASEEGSKETEYTGDPLILTPAGKGKVHASFKQSRNAIPGIAGSVQLHDLLKNYGLSPMSTGTYRRNMGWGHPDLAEIVGAAHNYQKTYNTDSEPDPLVGNASYKDGGPLWRDPRKKIYWKDLPKETVNVNGKSKTTLGTWTAENAPDESLIGKKATSPTISTSHQQGLDLDIGFYFRGQAKWAKITTKNQFTKMFNVDRNVAFLYSLCKNDKVYRIFWDRAMVKWTSEALGKTTFAPIPDTSGDEASGDIYHLAEETSNASTTITFNTENDNARFWNLAYSKRIKDFAQTNDIELPRIVISRWVKMGEKTKDAPKKMSNGTISNQWWVTVGDEEGVPLTLQWTQVINTMTTYLNQQSIESDTHNWTRSSDGTSIIGNPEKPPNLEKLKELINIILTDIRKLSKTEPQPEGVQPDKESSGGAPVTVLKMWEEVLNSKKLKHEPGHNDHYHIRLNISSYTTMDAKKFMTKYSTKKSGLAGIDHKKLRGMKIRERQKTLMDDSVTLKDLQRVYGRKLSYTFGKIDGGPGGKGQIIESWNQDVTTIGASMPKTMAAIAQLITHKGNPDAQMTDCELLGLLTYWSRGGAPKGHKSGCKTYPGSNEMLTMISKDDPRGIKIRKDGKTRFATHARGRSYQKRYGERFQKFGQIDKDQTKEVSKMFGVEKSNFLFYKGRNKQSTKDMFHFFAGLERARTGKLREGDPLKEYYQTHKDEIDRVISAQRERTYSRKVTGPTRILKKDPEAWGKGGLNDGSVNFAFVVRGTKATYVLVVYTQHPGSKKPKIKKKAPKNKQSDEYKSWAESPEGRRMLNYQAARKARNDHGYDLLNAVLKKLLKLAK